MGIEFNFLDMRCVNYLKSRNVQKKRAIIEAVFSAMDVGEQQSLTEALLPKGKHVHRNPPRGLKRKKKEGKNDE